MARRCFTIEGMTNTATDAEQLQTTIDSYFECWNSPDEASRMVAIERTWTAAATSTDPLADVTGHEAIANMMAGVGEQYPGHRFAQVGSIDVHHDLVRWGWQMVDPDGQQVIDGIDVAWVDPTGRISKLAGFFGAAIPSA